MSLYEYFLRLEAYQVKQVNMQENIALQAWLNQTVQATTGSKKNPKPKYTKFEEFFNSVDVKNNIHKTFNKDYVPQVESETEKKKRIAEERNKRYVEYMAKKKTN
ncbi:hypothetical protein [Lactobacillus terrae]|uniref:hypothetical protein n=1 Tax=Lactobacillus terrae TaxID=2269374 RepID=UPI0014754E7A|nr:hypothetical protein [Lactobacillus terrae]